MRVDNYSEFSLDSPAKLFYAIRRINIGLVYLNSHIVIRIPDPIYRMQLQCTPKQLTPEDSMSNIIICYRIVVKW